MHIVRASVPESFQQSSCAFTFSRNDESYASRVRAKRAEKLFEDSSRALYRLSRIALKRCCHCTRVCMLLGHDACVHGDISSSAACEKTRTVLENCQDIKSRFIIIAALWAAD